MKINWDALCITLALFLAVLGVYAIELAKSFFSAASVACG